MDFVTPVLPEHSWGNQPKNILSCLKLSTIEKADEKKENTSGNTRLISCQKLLDPKQKLNL